MKPRVYPYIPNSVPETKKEMLNKIGIKDVEALYRDIPEQLRYRKPLNLPEPLLSEFELEKHVKEIFSRNKSCEEFLNFLGAGAYQHYIPAVCDIIINRGEFLTAYLGTNYSDKGRFQAMFEYVSMLTELVGMDVAGYPVYDGSSAAATAIRMCARITGRSEILLPETISPLRMMVIRNYCRNSEVKTITPIKYDSQTGLIDLNDLKEKITSNTAGIYLENPSYLGMIEVHGREIADLAHAHGSLLAVGVNPMCLGVLVPPGHYGADIVTGDTQPLGVHMNFGGGAIGFVAVRDIEEHIAELPPLMLSIADLEEGEGFGFNLFAWPERLSYMGREHAKEYTGTATALWATANAVYMALMGPQGMKEIGESIMQRSHCAKKLLSQIPGVTLPFTSSHFNEFVVNFDETGKTVTEINESLLDHKIFGGKNLTGEFPQLGQSALYCVSEIHSVQDIKKLAYTLKEVIA